MHVFVFWILDWDRNGTSPLFQCCVLLPPPHPPSSSLHSLFTSVTPAVPRMPPRNVQVYNPTPNSLNVRWEPASGQVQQYRVAYSSLNGDRRPESVSPLRPLTRKLFE